VAFYGAATQGSAAGKLSVTPIAIETKATP